MKSDTTGTLACGLKSMIELLQTAVLDFGLLTGILTRSDVDDHLKEPDSLQFQFEEGVLQISAVADDDSVTASLGDKDVGFSTISNKNPWAHLVGGKVTAAWVLENNYAYQDGVEFEILLAAGEKFILRLLVIASTIHASLTSANFVSWDDNDG